MPFPSGPYARRTTFPPPGESTLHSSRKIDFAGEDYTVGDEGQYEGMDDVAQRVVLTVAFNVTSPKYIDERSLRETEQDIRSALIANGLMGGPEPEIELQQCTAVRSSAGRVEKIVKFKNLATGSKTSVTVP